MNDSKEAKKKQMGRSSGRIQNVSCLTKNSLESMEKRLNSSGIFSQDFRSRRFFRKIQDDLRERDIEPEKFTDRIIFTSMFNDIGWDKERKRWNVYSEVRKSQGVRENTLAGTLDVARSWRRKEVVCGILSHTPEGKWNSTERFKDTGHPVSKSISALRRGILKKNNRDTTHVNADASNTELLFRIIIHSVTQLSIFGAVSKRCEQFGLTEEEKGRGKPKEFVTKGVLTSVNSQNVKLLVSSPRGVSRNSVREIIQDFKSLTETIRFAQGFANSHSSGTGYQLV